MEVLVPHIFEAGENSVHFSSPVSDDSQFISSRDMQFSLDNNPEALFRLQNYQNFHFSASELGNRILIALKKVIVRQ